MARICSRRLLIGDVDSAGIAFAGRIVAIALEVREQGLHEAGLDFAQMIRQGPYGTPIVHLDTDFKMPMRHGDTIHGDLVCERIGDSSFTTRVNLILAANNAVAASVRIIAACVQLSSMTSLPIPDDMRAPLTRLLLPQAATQ